MPVFSALLGKLSLLRFKVFPINFYKNQKEKKKAKIYRKGIGRQILPAFPNHNASGRVDHFAAGFAPPGSGSMGHLGATMAIRQTGSQPQRQGSVSPERFGLPFRYLFSPRSPAKNSVIAVIARWKEKTWPRIKKTLRGWVPTSSSPMNRGSS